MSIGEASIGELSIGEPWTGGINVGLSSIAMKMRVASVTVTGGGTVDLSAIRMVMDLDSVTASGGADITLGGISMVMTVADVTVISVTPAFYDLIKWADGAGQYLVEVNMVPAGDADFTAGGAPGSIGEYAIGEPPAGSSLNVGETTTYLSDRYWVGSPDDYDRPNVFYDARISTPLVIERRVPLLPEESRRASRQYGFIEWFNDDGAWDGIIPGQAVDGRGVKVLYGPAMAPDSQSYTDFQSIAELLGDTIELNGEKVRLSVRDKAQPLDRIFQRETYDGSGETEGNADLVGINKPYTLGEVYNVTPQIIDPTYLVYQYHIRQTEGVVAVYDRGLALDLDTSVGTSGDVSNWASLVGATIATGKYITCNALGIFRVESTPAGLITIDAKGDKTDGTYIDTVDDMAWHIATVQGEVQASNANQNTFTALPTYTAGLYLSPGDASKKTGSEVLGELLASVGAYWDISKKGTLRVDQHTDPQDEDYQYWIDEADIIDIQPTERPKIRWRNPVGYKRNWTVQRGEDLADSVTAARRQYLATTELVAGKASENLNILERQPEAFNPPDLSSLLVSETDADAVASAQMSLHGAARRTFTVILPRIGYLYDLGDVLSIKYPRFGLNQRRNWRVISIRTDADRDQIKIGVWG